MHKLISRTAATCQGCPAYAIDEAWYDQFTMQGVRRLTCGAIITGERTADCPGLSLSPGPVRPNCGDCDQVSEGLCVLHWVYCGDSAHGVNGGTVACLHHQDFAAYREALRQYQAARRNALDTGAVESEEPEGDVPA